MKSRLSLLITLSAVVIIVFIGCSGKNGLSTLKEGFEKSTVFIESKLKEMDKEVDGKATTSVTTTTYTNSDGKVVMTFYLLKTEYEGNTPEITRLNIGAIEHIIAASSVDETRECKVGNYPAMIYESAEHSYLCWTISDEISCVIEYDESDVPEEEIFKVAKSVE